MLPCLSVRRAFVALCLSLLALPVLAQDKPGDPGYQPEVGQEGKDVVWVPTPQSLVDRMLNLAKVKPGDFLMDLGSGDGRTVITAAKRGVQALGIEYNPDMVALSQRNAKREGVSAKAQFRRADLFETDFSKATVITMFLLPEINLKLRPKILDLKPGTRVVSNSFTMGEWQHDASAQATSDEGCSSYCTAYLWIVPAKVAGTWDLGGGELALEQEFQVIKGTLSADGRKSSVSGRLNGDRISFKAGGVQYTGRVSGDTMQVSAGSGRSWSATRAGR